MAHSAAVGQQVPVLGVALQVSRDKPVAGTVRTATRAEAVQRAADQL
jgi:hypothetical protein